MSVISAHCGHVAYALNSDRIADIEIGCFVP